MRQLLTQRAIDANHASLTPAHRDFGNLFNIFALIKLSIRLDKTKYQQHFHVPLFTI